VGVNKQGWRDQGPNLLPTVTVLVDELRRHHTGLLCDDVVDGDGARRRLASAEQCLKARQSREDLEEAHRGAVDVGGVYQSRAKVRGVRC
jgi:hypothetical protein